MFLALGSEKASKYIPHYRWLKCCNNVILLCSFLLGNWYLFWNYRKQMEACGTETPGSYLELSYWSWSLPTSRTWDFMSLHSPRHFHKQASWCYVLGTDFYFEMHVQQTVWHHQRLQCSAAGAWLQEHVIQGTYSWEQRVTARSQFTAAHLRLPLQSIPVTSPRCLVATPFNPLETANWHVRFPLSQVRGSLAALPLGEFLLRCSSLTQGQQGNSSGARPGAF